MKMTIKELRQVIRGQLNELTSAVFQEVQPTTDFKASKNIKMGFDKLTSAFPQALALQLVVQYHPELKGKSPQELTAAYDQQVGPYVKQMDEQFNQELAQFVEDKFASAIKQYKRAGNTQPAQQPAQQQASSAQSGVRKQQAA